jgi:hypothetical protein
MTSSKTLPGDVTAQLYLPITDGRVDVDNDALHPGATGARGPIDSQEDDIAAAETAALVVRAPGRTWPRSGRRASNPRPQAWEACALPTELRPQSARL